jgi:hypothetical protein
MSCHENCKAINNANVNSLPPFLDFLFAVNEASFAVALEVSADVYEMFA